MRTTLDIDTDVLQAARERARREHSTAGRVLSALARQGLMSASPAPSVLRGGVPVIPAAGRVVTVEHIQTLMDQDGV